MYISKSGQNPPPGSEACRNETVRAHQNQCVRTPSPLPSLRLGEQKMRFGVIVKEMISHLSLYLLKESFAAISRSKDSNTVRVSMVTDGVSGYWLWPGYHVC